jgi:hypothetical protein
MALLLLLLLICSGILPVQPTLSHVLCSLPSSDQLIVGDVPSTFEFNSPYTGERTFEIRSICTTVSFLEVTVASNSSLLLPYIMLDIDLSTNASNTSICRPTNRSESVFRHKTEFILTFAQNITQHKCVQLR